MSDAPQQAATPHMQTAQEIMATLDREVMTLRAERDLMRMQAAAVMTASIQNTETSIKDRIGRENPYWTQCYADVCAAVDREMKLRAERDALVKERDGLIRAWNAMAHALQPGPIPASEPTAMDYILADLESAIDAARSSGGKGAT